jgi:hypothetical protein
MSIIIEQAESGQFTEFHFLQDWSEYKFYRGKYRSFKLLIGALQKNSKVFLKRYSKNIIDGSADFTELLVYQKLQQVITYYKQELEIINNMIREYEAYLANGNFFRAWLGGVRTEDWR